MKPCKTQMQAVRVTAEMLLALKAAENALADYIPQLEAHGASLYYGHCVLRQVRAAIALIEFHPKGSNK